MFNAHYHKKVFLNLWLLICYIIPFTAQGQSNVIAGKAKDHTIYVLKSSRNVVEWKQWAQILSVKSKHEYLVTNPNMDSLGVYSDIVVSPYNPKDKYNKAEIHLSEELNGAVRIYVLVRKDVDIVQLWRKIAQAGGNRDLDAYAARAGWLAVIIDIENISKLAAIDDILYIGHNAIDIPLNKEAVAITNASLLQVGITGLNDSLLGAGQVVGVGDDGDPSHVDINDRLIQNFSHALGSGHGIHTTVTTGGAGIRDQLFTGFAPKASLIGQFFSGVLFFGQDMYQDFGMRITNNSYANGRPQCSNFGQYNLYSRYIDSQSIQFPDLLHVFAAGNYATFNCPPYPPGYGTVASSYQSAKNPLVVGNLGKHIFQYNNTTSRGPTLDGRLKPEIMAQGMQVMSGGKDDSYYSNTGTSMAAPNVAGTAALVREQYARSNGGASLNADLLKALLMNGAQDIYSPHPDYISGFGLMDAKQSVTMLVRNQYIVDSIAPSTTLSYTIPVPVQVSKLKVMLYWADVPVAPSPDTALIHDLDIVVKREASTFLPWVLNPNSPIDTAIRAVDKLNNVEQVTIDNPGAGDYTIEISASTLTTDKQRFVIVYDYEMDGIDITYPVSNTHIPSGVPFYTYFKTPKRNSEYTISLSVNGGQDWEMLQSNVGDSLRHFFIENTSTINSTKCIIRVLQNATGRTAISDTFSITNRVVLKLMDSAHQCPGSIAVQWAGVSAATHYVLYRNVAGVMTPIDTVPNTVLNYLFTSLPHHISQWVAVAPIIDGRVGIRSESISSTPNYGGCAHTSLPAYDVALSEILLPSSGRILTSSQLTDTEQVSIKIINTGQNQIDEISIGVMLDGALALEETIGVTLSPGKDTILTSLGDIDMSELGDYALQVFLLNGLYNINSTNDSLSLLVRHVDNSPIDKEIGFLELFENISIPTFNSSKWVALPGADAWDYYKDKGYGRLRSFVMSSNNIEGNKSMTLDLAKNIRNIPDSLSTNQLVFTMNMSAIDIDQDEMRLDFLYRYAGMPKYSQDNSVYLRGSDMNTWIRVGDIDTHDIARVKRYTPISINDVLTAEGQTFSTSTQMMIQQRDTALIVGPDYGNGLTVDSIHIYNIKHDIALVAVTNPKPFSCEQSNDQQITLQVKNTVFTTAYDIPITYQLNGGAVLTAIIDSISPKSSIDYTFPISEDFSLDTVYHIRAWVSYPLDEQSTNDSIMDYFIYKNKPIIAFPYLNSFDDSTNKDFFVLDTNSSWSRKDTYGFQSKGGKNGKYLWHTEDIDQPGKSGENYLYSRCFDISSLAQPMLSFSFAGRFQDDDEMNVAYARVEYCADGVNWQALDTGGYRYNWYDGQWSRGRYDWQLATHSLPDVDNISFRIFFRSLTDDDFYSFAIDDIHIYDGGLVCYEDNGSISVTASMIANEHKSFTQADKLIGIVNSERDIADASLTQHNHTSIQVNDALEMVLPTNFVLASSNDSDVNKKLQLFLPHQSFIDIANDNSCDICSKPRNPYLLGVSTYHGNKSEWDELLDNNTQNLYQVNANEEVEIVPYMNGYRFEFRTNKFGEYWFNDAPYIAAQSINFTPVVLNGTQLNNATIKLDFTAYINDQISAYFLQRRDEQGDFITIREYTPASGVVVGYDHYDKPMPIASTYDYRVVYQLQSGAFRYTNVVSFDWRSMTHFNIHPNPVTNSSIEVSYALDEHLPITYAIYDVSGKLLHSFQYDIEDKRGSFIIDLNRMALSRGTYYLKLISGNVIEGEQFIFLK